jgi:hypothetical protein
LIGVGRRHLAVANAIVDADPLRLQRGIGEVVAERRQIQPAFFRLAVVAVVALLLQERNHRGRRRRDRHLHAGDQAASRIAKATIG